MEIGLVKVRTNGVAAAEGSVLQVGRASAKHRIGKGGMVKTCSVHAGAAEVDVGQVKLPHVHAREVLLTIEELHDLDCVESLVRITALLNQLVEAIVLALALQPLDLRNVGHDRQHFRTSKVPEDEMEEAGVAVDAQGAFGVLALAMVVPKCRQDAVREARETADGGLKQPSANMQLHEGVLSVSGDKRIHLGHTRLDLFFLDNQGLQARKLASASCLKAAFALGDRL